MQQEGRLAAFNRAYAAHHEQRRSLGCGCMSYGHALGKLKRSLVPVLARGAAIEAVNFAAILGG
jgi:hypothetical protein